MGQPAGGRRPGINVSTRRRVYDRVAAVEKVTKAELAAAADLSLPTVTKYLAHLEGLGLIEQGAKLASGSQGGRSPITYQCIPDGRVAVGVDVAGDHVNLAVVNLEGDVTHVRELDLAYENSRQYAEMVAGRALKMLADAGIPVERVCGAGVAVPGLVSEEEQRVTYGRVIDNTGMTVEDFARALPFPVRLVHDSDAAGLAEFWTGYDGRNAFYMSISNSIGGSVLINGSIYHGDGEFSGEAGHLIVEPGGRACYCGQRGCLDAYCNANVLRCAGGDLPRFFERLSAGEVEIQQVWDTYCSKLATAIQCVRVLYGCVVVVGGDVGTHIGSALEDVRRKVDALDLLPGSPSDYLVPSRFATKPIATGAGLRAIEDFKEQLGPAPRPGR